MPHELAGGVEIIARQGSGYQIVYSIDQRLHGIAALARAEVAWLGGAETHEAHTVTRL